MIAKIRYEHIGSKNFMYLFDAILRLLEIKSIKVECLDCTKF